MTIHTIRLRGPWQAVTGRSRQEISLPGSLAGLIHRGPEALRLQRKFNCPTGLAGQRVDLVIGGCSLPLRASLNGHALPPQARGLVAFSPPSSLEPRETAEAKKPPDPFRAAELRWEITSLLQPHNELQLELDPPVQEAIEAELGLVALEIHA